MFFASSFKSLFDMCYFMKKLNDSSWYRTLRRSFQLCCDKNVNFRHSEGVNILQSQAFFVIFKYLQEIEMVQHQYQDYEVSKFNNFDGT